MRHSMRDLIRSFAKRPYGMAALLSLLATLSYTFWVLATHYNVATEPAVSSFLLIALSLLFGILALNLSRQDRFDSKVRVAWLLLGIGGICNSIAESFWLYEES